MEPLNNDPLPGADPVPGTDPTPTATPAPIVPTPAAAPAPKFEQGGSVGFMSDINWTDVGMIALVATSMFFIIKYYRNKVNERKNEKTITDRRLEELESQMQNFLGKK
jgi:hypothetical protein